MTIGDVVRRIAADRMGDSVHDVNVPEAAANYARVLEYFSENEARLHPHYAEDMVRLLLNALNVADCMSRNVFAVDQIISLTSQMQTTCQAIVTHALRSRPIANGYGVYDNARNVLHRQVFRSEAAAMDYITDQKELGQGDTLSLLPVTVSSAGARPPPSSVVSTPSPSPTKPDPELEPHEIPIDGSDYVANALAAIKEEK